MKTPDTPLVIGCPVCAAQNQAPGAAAQWKHAGCGGDILLHQETRLLCADCGESRSLRDCGFSCHNQSSEVRLGDGPPASDSEIIAVGGMLVGRLGRQWLIGFLKALDVFEVNPEAPQSPNPKNHPDYPDPAN